MSSFYEDRIFPVILDVALRKLAPDRQRVVNNLRGKVLEIGVGTGANLPHYHPDVEVVGIEPGAAMLRKAQQRADRLTKERSTKAPVPKVTLQQASAEALPFADQSFDQVAEAVRVLKPGGEMHFFEHVRSPDAGVALWQDRINPLWRKFACGCHLNRLTHGLLKEHGLQVVMHEQGYHPAMGLKVASYVVQGVATKPAG